MALGGSTNAVLHLLAIARAAGVELTLDDFQVCFGGICMMVSLFFMCRLLRHLSFRSMVHLST